MSLNIQKCQCCDSYILVSDSNRQLPDHQKGFIKSKICMDCGVKFTRFYDNPYTDYLTDKCHICINNEYSNDHSTSIEESEDESVKKSIDPVKFQDFIKLESSEM